MSRSLTLSVQRREPVLVCPDGPTPYELKRVSDVDDQGSLRFWTPFIQFYRRNPSMAGRDPARVIKDALAKALVFYYPLAGRLREGPARKLFVECTGEGVRFVGGDADVRLDHFFSGGMPPADPNQEELLYDVETSNGILNCPLLLIQVTRLLCGGFVFAISIPHVMSDAPGLVLFMNAVAEIARGAAAPTVPPVWARELFDARSPPRSTFAHREYDHVPDTKGTDVVSVDDMAYRSIFFGPREIAAIRNQLPPHLRRQSSTFEVLTAYLWKCRTLAIQPDPDELVRVIVTVSIRGKFSAQLPAGYYGNTVANPVAISEAGRLCGAPLEYALELVRKAKREVNEEYLRSVADTMVIRGRPQLTLARAFLVSDMTRAGFREVDFGWGKSIYGCLAKRGMGAITGVLSSYVPYRNEKGEEGIVVPLHLPGPAMERFAMEMARLAKESTLLENNGKIVSAM